MMERLGSIDHGNTRVTSLGVEETEQSEQTEDLVVDVQEEKIEEIQIEKGEVGEVEEMNETVTEMKAENEMNIISSTIEVPNLINEESEENP